MIVQHLSLVKMINLPPLPMIHRGSNLEPTISGKAQGSLFYAIRGLLEKREEERKITDQPTRAGYQQANSTS
jgi:hypothetical protein